MDILNLEPKNTAKLTSSATVQSLDNALLFRDVNGILSSKFNKVDVVQITVENNPIRIGFNTDPTQDANGGIGQIINVGTVIRLEGFTEAQRFKFITKTGANHAILQVIPFF